MIKVATVCSGIGSPEQALKELGIPHEISFACEIDKWARKTYQANFTPNQMFTDMTQQSWDRTDVFSKEDKLYSDLFIGGIPCQAFSLAGKRLGELDKRGLLFYDFYRYVKNQQPKAFIIENVRGLLSDNGGKTFKNWCYLLGQSINNNINFFNHEDSLMYNLHFTILNSRDFGIPQNRERVFLVGIRSDLSNTFLFPKTQRLKKRLIDILEPVVDEKYYLSDNMIKHLEDNSSPTRIISDVFDVSPCILANQAKVGTDAVLLKEVSVYKERRTQNGKNVRKLTGTNSFSDKEGFFEISDIANTVTTIQKDALIKIGQLPGYESSNRVYSEQGLAPTVRAKQQGLIHVKEATKKGYSEAVEGDSINFSNPNSKTRRGRVGKGIANTLYTQCNQGVIDGYRIRKYTPLEVMRLMGYPDDYVKPCSDFQTYKQAGNSIVVNVMKAVIKQLLPIIE